MKNNLVTIAFLITTQLAFSQNKRIEPSPITLKEVHAKSRALKNIDAIQIATNTSYEEFNHSGSIQLYEQSNNAIPFFANSYYLFQSKDEAINIKTNFEGVNSLQVSNPDSDGDVGPNHYMQMVKRSFAIWDKEGNLLYGPADNNTLWQDLPGAWHNNWWTDPIVQYDHLEDRWLASCMVYDIANGIYWEMIAISATPDPLEEWNLYAYEFPNMPDYPKFGVWPDGYYLSINEYDLSSGTQFEGASVLVFNKEDMILGVSDPKYVYFNFETTQPIPTVHNELSSFQPSDLDGPPPPYDTPNYFVSVRDDIWGWDSDQLQIWECSIDWASMANSSFEEVITLETEAFNSNTAEFTYISQPNGNSLHSLAHFLMYRLQYRIFEDYEVLLTNHTVDVGNSHAGIRWYELRNYGSGWEIYQSGDYAPDSVDRWMASIAMDKDGNIALGYSASGTETYPSIRVTGRKSTDFLGEMTFPETEVITGSGCQINHQRWGDYSMLTLDPTNDLDFWYTQQYITTTADFNWQTRIAEFNLHRNLDLSIDTIKFDDITDCIEGKQLMLKNNSGYDIQVDNIDNSGTFENNISWESDFDNNTCPIILNDGDSILINIYIPVPLKSEKKGYDYSAMNIYTDYANHTAIIALNDEIIFNIDENENIPIEIFPNPFKESVTIEIPLYKNRIEYLKIIDVNGSCINNEYIEVDQKQFHWNGTNNEGNRVQAGIYILQLYDNQGNIVKSSKLLKM